MPDQTIVFLSNTSEDVWPFIKGMSDPDLRSAEIEENARLSDRDLFAFSEINKFVFITPRPVSASFLAYYQSLLGNKEIEILVPKVHSGRLCADVLNDRQVFSRLKELGRVGPLSLWSYSSSASFHGLVRELRATGAAVETPQAPQPDDAWTVNFFGSKTGIRQLVQQLHEREPAARMATGFIVDGLTNGANLAAARHVQNNGVVLKTQKGHAGAGVLIFPPDKLPRSFAAAREQIAAALRQDEYWSKFPMVIEDYIPADQSLAGGFPSAEFRVEPDGQVTFLYACGMRVTPAGMFRGVEIHEGVVPSQNYDQMQRIGRAIGETYARYGYRGYFDVDFALTADRTLFVTESNVRRTGGTHVYHTARALFGSGFLKDTYTLSDNGRPLTKSYTLAQLLAALQPVLFDRNRSEGVIVCSENLLGQNKLAYIVFALNKTRAEEIEAEMEHLLRVRP